MSTNNKQDENFEVDRRNDERTHHMLIKYVLKDVDSVEYQQPEDENTVDPEH